MSPVLLSIGPVTIYNLSLFIILAWISFSFIFWKKCRDHGIEEEKIYDLMFYATISAFVFSRFFYVISHTDIFAKDWLRIAAFWIVPGFSLYGALFGSFLVIYFLSKKNKIRIASIFDIFWTSVLSALVIGNIGALLDGSAVGKITDGLVYIYYKGHIGPRHPIQLYSLIAIIAIFVINYLINKKYKHLPLSFSGLFILLAFSLTQFMVEFFRQSNFYFYKFTLEQWILLVLFCEAAGGLFVKNNLHLYLGQLLDKSKHHIIFKSRDLYEKIRSQTASRDKK